MNKLNAILASLESDNDFEVRVSRRRVQQEAPEPEPEKRITQCPKCKGFMPLSFEFIRLLNCVSCNHDMPILAERMPLNFADRLGRIFVGIRTDEVE